MERHQQIVSRGGRHWPVDSEPWPATGALEAEFLRGSDHEEDRFLERFDKHLRCAGQWHAAQRQVGRSLAVCALWEVETDGDWGTLDVGAWLGAELCCMSDDGLMELAQAFVFWLRSEGRLSARGQRRLQSRIQLQLRPMYTLGFAARAA